MGKSIGRSLSQGLGLGKIPRRADGIYPTKESGLGQYGSTAYPTVIESYNRETDYKRWRLGMEYYFGAGRSWAEIQIRSFGKFFNSAAGNDELDMTGSKEITALIPSGGSPEKAWYCSCRTRGSLILPSPLDSAAITLNTSDPDPANHTLVYDCSAFYSPNQVAVYNSFIGDQFEDTASGPNYPDDLVQKPVGSVALTLISVNIASRTLVFDLSRPCVRVFTNGRIYWKREEYDPTDPLSWNTSSGRHLCSSFKFFCCCPDHLGGALANLEYPGGNQATMSEFPLPNTGRAVNSAWERQGAGYYRQWRTLPDRRDARRDCKHIHAYRWQCGVPWLEPSDYPIGGERNELEALAQLERGYSSAEIYDFFRLGKLNWDRYALTVGNTVGLVIFPGGDVRDNVRPDARPMLWNDSQRPLDSWCRNNDWWLQKGTQELKIYNFAAKEFRDKVVKGGIEYPILEIIPDTAARKPVIVQ